MAQVSEKLSEGHGYVAHVVEPETSELSPKYTRLFQEPESVISTAHMFQVLKGPDLRATSRMPFESQGSGSNTPYGTIRSVGVPFKG
jgi:hypothetical protein